MSALSVNLQGLEQTGFAHVIGADDQIDAAQLFHAQVVEGAETFDFQRIQQ